MLFHVYDDPKPAGYFINEPQGFYRTMLDADWVMYILLPGLLIAVIIALMYAWHLHEIPKHKAERKKMRQAELVSALTALGLFEHWVWVVALTLAYMDWDAVDNWVISIVQRSRDALLQRPPVILADEPEPAVDMRAADTVTREPTPASTPHHEEPRP